MRDIKFRRWSKNTEGKWRMKQCHPGDLYESFGTMGCEGELMQFTGLKDKNGKEIYEGDIIQPKNMHDSNIDYWHMTDGRAIPIVRVVEWKNVGFNIPDEVEYWEVVGNIYENKDLLTPTGA